METINLEEIFNNYSETDCDYCYTKESILLAMKIACDKVLDLASENAELNYGEDEGQSTSLDKGSILQIKNWIK